MTGCDIIFKAIKGDKCAPSKRRIYLRKDARHKRRKKEFSRVEADLNETGQKPENSGTYPGYAGRQARTPGADPETSGRSSQKTRARYFSKRRGAIARPATQHRVHLTLAAAATPHAPGDRATKRNGKTDMSEKAVKNKQTKRAGSEAQTNGKDNTKKKVSPLTIVGIVLCVILIPVLIANVTMIVKGLVNKNKVPTFFGRAPLIVLTDSMSPLIKAGDLIVVKSVDPAQVKEGDVISFFDPASSGNAVVTHRVLKQNKTDADKLPAWHNMDNLPGIEGEGENLIFRTQGDFNNTRDEDPVPADKLVGVWTGFCWRGAGNVAMFLQSTPGLILCIGVPIVLLVAYELIRRKIYEKSKQRDTEDLLKELEDLKQAQKQQGDNASAAVEGAAAQAQKAVDNTAAAADNAASRAAELQAQLEALQAQLKAQQAQAQSAGETISASVDPDGKTS